MTQFSYCLYSWSLLCSSPLCFLHALFYWWLAAAAAAKSLQSCPTLCNPIDGSPPGFPVPGILQARTLEWVAISFSNAWKWKVKVKSLSRVWLLATPWTAAYQAPLPMGFSRQEYWSGVPLPYMQYTNYLLACLLLLPWWASWTYRPLTHLVNITKFGKPWEVDCWINE